LLRAVQVNLLDREECIKLYAAENKITPRMICAGVPEGGKDACNKDSGGALVLKKSGKQVGLVSWGTGCGEKEHPGVYANLADKQIHDFIESQVKPYAIKS